MRERGRDQSRPSLAPAIDQWCDQLRALFAHPIVVVWAVVVAVVWKLLRRSPADHDLFARLGMGRLVQSLGAVPSQDPFAFTEKLPEWIDHEWLSGVVFYQLVSRWGDPGLIVLKLVVVIWTTLLVVRASYIYWRQVPGQVVWAIVCLLEAAHLWASTVRCQIFTYLVIALIYYGFAKYRVHGSLRTLALVPCALVALVNMHGGYALALVLLWLLTLGSIIEQKSWRMLAVVAAVSLLAPILTPYGFDKFVSYLLRALSMKRPTITEWQPLYYDISSSIRVALITAVMVLGVVLRARRGELHLTALIVLGFSIYCGVSHIRFIGFAMITLAVFGGGYWACVINWLSQRAPQRSTEFARIGAVVGLATFLVMIFQIFVTATRADTWRLDTSSYPTAAVEWLRKSGSTGRLLVDFNNGSFAFWRLYPQFLVSIDGRYEELYTDQTFNDAALALRPQTPEGAAALARIAPTHILFSQSSESGGARAALSPEWHELYRDEHYSIVTTSALAPESPVPADRAEQDLWDPLF